MKIAFVALALCSSLVIAPATTVLAQEVLTNDSIVQMVRAGLPESVIVAKIRSTRTTFDLRTEALVGLKQASVPDKVLEAMVEQSAQAGSPVSPASPLPPSAAAPPLAGTVMIPGVPVPIPIQAGVGIGHSGIEALQGRGTVYHVLADKQVELMPVGAEIQTNTIPVIGYTKSELVLPGSKAGYRTAERQPVFLSSQSPSEMPLVRLKPGSDDRNLKFSSGSRVPLIGVSQRQGVRAEDKIDVETERDGRGFFRVRPRKPLEPGEYGFVLTHGFAGATSGKVYDFGVD